MNICSFSTEDRKNVSSVGDLLFRPWCYGDGAGADNLT